MEHGVEPICNGMCADCVCTILLVFKGRMSIKKIEKNCSFVIAINHRDFYEIRWVGLVF